MHIISRKCNHVRSKTIIRCHQRPRIIQEYQDNSWAHFIEMYD
jgi:hypothetical protein